MAFLNPRQIAINERCQRLFLAERGPHHDALARWLPRACQRTYSLWRTFLFTLGMRDSNAVNGV